MPATAGHSSCDPTGPFCRDARTGPEFGQTRSGGASAIVARQVSRDRRQPLAGKSRAMAVQSSTGQLRQNREHGIMLDDRSHVCWLAMAGCSESYRASSSGIGRPNKSRVGSRCNSPTMGACACPTKPFTVACSYKPEVFWRGSWLIIFARGESWGDQRTAAPKANPEDKSSTACRSVNVLLRSRIAPSRVIGRVTWSVS